MKKHHTTKRAVSLFAVISFALFAVCVILFIASESSADLADLLNSSVCHLFRRAMAAFGDIFPFSLFELLVILIPLILTLVIILAVRTWRRGNGRLRFVINLFAVVLLVGSEYILSLGIAYNTTTVGEKMNIPDTEVTEERLAEVMISLRDEINALASEISYGDNGASAPAYTFEEMSDKICDSYTALAEQYGLNTGFDSRAKQIYFGNVMSYLRLTGIYTFYTGEANVNSAYPMYDLCFTSAHELSHQRGILRENEANFMAYLICATSDDSYLRYSAALSMYSYIGSALYRTNKELYREINAELSYVARGDIIASDSVTQKYGNTFLADISEFMNDLFLKSNGTAGVVTYGRVVELTVAYYEMKK